MGMSSSEKKKKEYLELFGVRKWVLWKEIIKPIVFSDIRGEAIEKFDWFPGSFPFTRMS
jgi:hypothetical protein